MICTCKAWSRNNIIIQELMAGGGEGHEAVLVTKYHALIFEKMLENI